MLSQSTAEALRQAGLVWTPRALDFFAIPGADFAGQVFAITDMTITAEALYGQPAVLFHGSVEWALDHLWMAEVVWIPREDQLRELLEEWLAEEGADALTLVTTQLGYRCTIRSAGEALSFEAFDASEAYGAALLHLLAASLS